MSDATNVPAYGGFVSDDNILSVCVRVADPTADAKIPLFRAPVKGRIRAAYAISEMDQAANGTVLFSVNLLNGGAAGTATTVISGTVGGTGGWSKNVPVTVSVTTPALAAGDWVTLNYDETGTVAPYFTVQLDVDLYPTS